MLLVMNSSISYGESIYGVLGNPEKYLDKKIFLVGFLVKKSEITLYPTEHEVLIPRDSESIMIDALSSQINRHELDCYDTYVSVVGVLKLTDPIVLDEIIHINKVNKDNKFDPKDLCWSSK